MNCLICGAPAASPKRRVQSPYAPVEYTLFACGECGSRFFDPTEHAVDLQMVYDDHAREGEHIGRAFQRSAYWEGEVRRISQLHAGPVRSVLDVGCRTGDFLMHWPEAVRRVGVELAAPSAETALSRGLEIIQVPLEQAEFATHFDVVTCYAILEHLTDPRPVLGSLARLVAPNGVLVTMVPGFETAKAGILERMNRRWSQYNPPQHFCFYSRQYLDSFFTARRLALSERRYAAGGMFNPFRSIRVARWVFARGLEWVESHTALSRVPVFDHMYSYYTTTDAAQRPTQ